MKIRRYSNIVSETISCQRPQDNTSYTEYRFSFIILAKNNFFFHSMIWFVKFLLNVNLHFSIYFHCYIIIQFIMFITTTYFYILFLGRIVLLICVYTYCYKFLSQVVPWNIFFNCYWLLNTGCAFKCICPLNQHLFCIFDRNWIMTNMKIF